VSGIIDTRPPRISVFTLTPVAIAACVWAVLIFGACRASAADCPLAADQTPAGVTLDACLDACDAANPECTVWTPHGETADGTLCQEDFDQVCVAGCQDTERLCSSDDPACDDCEKQCRQECSERDGGEAAACQVSCPFVCAGRETRGEGMSQAPFLAPPSSLHASPCRAAPLHAVPLLACLAVPRQSSPIQS